MATKDFSSKQEKMIADMLGWKVVAGSGAAACYPGDIEGDDWLGECKTHTTPGHNIYFSKSVWDKIKDEAMIKRRHPVLFVDDGSQKVNKTWCLLQLNLFDMEDCTTHNMSKGVNKNISFDGVLLSDQRSTYQKEHPGFESVFVADWHNEKVAIVPLSLFCDKFGE